MYIYIYIYIYIYMRSHTVSLIGGNTVYVQYLDLCFLSFFLIVVVPYVCDAM